MFVGKTAIDKICKNHYRTLHGVYNNFMDSYEALLSINNDISTYQKHLLHSAVTVYKIAVEINPEFM